MYTKEFKDKVLNEYEIDKIPSIELSRKHNINKTSITNWHKEKYNIKNMNPDKGNTRYFQKIDTKLKAYFLGFIAADGCITNKNCLKINIVEDDKIILEKFKEEIGCLSHLYQTPKKIGRNQITFSMSDKNLVNDIKQYGITERKSLTMQNIISNIPKEYRDSFILGYFDGDGFASISKIKYLSKKTGEYKIYPLLHIGFCGTKDFLLGIVKEIKTEKFNIKHESGIDNLLMSSSKNELIKTYNYLYKDNTFFLKRKHDKFVEYFKSIHIEINQDGTISSP